MTQDEIDDKLEEDYLWARQEREIGDDYYRDCYDGYGDPDYAQIEEDKVWSAWLNLELNFVNLAKMWDNFIIGWGRLGYNFDPDIIPF